MSNGNGNGHGSRKVDPDGRRALFSAASPRQSRRDEPLATWSRGEGRQAVFSAAPPDAPADGTVLVECSACRARTPVAAGAVWRHLLPSLWTPLKASYPVWMHCPACGRRTWCGLHWEGVLRAVRKPGRRREN